MGMLRLVMLFLIFVLFTACSSGDSSGITQPVDLKQFTVEVYLENRIIPDSVNITVFSKNNVIEKTVKTRKQCFSGSPCLFETAPLQYGEYAKITAFTHAISENDTMKMEFSSFAPMNANVTKPLIDDGSQNPVLNIYTATASKAVEYFLREKQMSYEDATKKAYDNMKDFGISDREFERDRCRPNVSSMSPIQIPYVYTRYFISDSVFYSDFLELQDAIRDGEWADTLFRVRAADAFVRTFKNLKWNNVPGMTFYGYDDYIPDFWESTYGMDVCNDKYIGDTLVNANRRSEFYDSVFVCAGRMKQGYIKWQHWRIREPEEEKMGICNPNELRPGEINTYNPQVAEMDSIIYTCGLEGWEKTNDVNIILKYRQIPCNVETNSRTYIYNDSLYLCHTFTYSDKEWPTAYLFGQQQQTYYAWTGDKDIIDSVYPEGVPDSALLINVEGL